MPVVSKLGSGDLQGSLKALHYPEGPHQNDDFNLNFTHLINKYQLECMSPQITDFTLITVIVPG